MKIASKEQIQCRITLKNGRQCPNEAVEGTDVCLMHGGQVYLNTKRKNDYESTALQFWTYEINKINESNSAKSLKDEVGILKVLLNSYLAKCKDANDLIMNSTQIQNIVHSIEKVLNSYIKLERILGDLLDKEQLAIFADSIIQILIKEIKDTEIIDNISKQIILLIKET